MSRSGNSPYCQEEEIPHTVKKRKFPILSRIGNSPYCQEEEIPHTLKKRKFPILSRRGNSPYCQEEEIPHTIKKRKFPILSRKGNSPYSQEEKFPHTLKKRKFPILSRRGNPPYCQADEISYPPSPGICLPKYPYVHSHALLDIILILSSHLLQSLLTQLFLSGIQTDIYFTFLVSRTYLLHVLWSHIIRFNNDWRTV